jgi:hypothetical protein
MVRFVLPVACLVLLAGACGGSRPTSDAATDGVGTGGQSGGAGSQGGATGGHAGATGGAGTQGTGGQIDAGSCRLEGQTCGAGSSCCIPLICAGSCTMGVLGTDAATDAAAMCSYADGGALDGGAFVGGCPAAGCPAGTFCVAEIGGVAGGGGEYCAPIPIECHGTQSCACMATCACTSGIGRRPELCSEQSGYLACDNGIR